MEKKNRPRHVVLIGLMGSGKSSLGEPLARRLGMTYLDNDDELEHWTGRTAKDVADTEGLDALHREEAAILLDALASDTASVIGAAASTITEREIRERLRDAFVVWLDRSPAELARKNDDADHRPSGAGDLDTIERLYAERAPLYRAVARLVVHPGEHASDEELVELIAEAVRRDEAPLP